VQNGSVVQSRVYRAAERQTSHWLTMPSLRLTSSDDFVDLVRLQKGRSLFQLSPPFHQDPSHRLGLVMALINDLLDSHFPFFKRHRLTRSLRAMLKACEEKQRLQTRECNGG
jgi:hypothetical protein